MTKKSKPKPAANVNGRGTGKQKLNDLTAEVVELIERKPSLRDASEFQSKIYAALRDLGRLLRQAEKRLSADEYSGLAPDLLRDVIEKYGADLDCICWQTQGDDYRSDAVATIANTWPRKPDEDEEDYAGRVTEHLRAALKSCPMNGGPMANRARNSFAVSLIDADELRRMGFEDERPIRTSKRRNASKAGA